MSTGATAVNAGDDINAYVVSLDRENKKIALALSKEDAEQQS